MLENKNNVLVEALFSKRCHDLNIHNWIEDYSKHIIPVDIPYETINYRYYDRGGEPVNFYKDSGLLSFSPFMVRDVVISYVGFSLPTKEVSNRLAKYIGDRSVLEIMSGLGAWSFALKESGANIVATTDLKLEQDRFTPDREWVDVEELDCLEAIYKYRTDVILCSWPRGGSPFLETCKRALNMNPNCEIIYIGEGDYGCCAGNDFFDWYYENNDIVLDILPIALDNWEGIHDSIYTVTRNMEGK